MTFTPISAGTIAVTNNSAVVTFTGSPDMTIVAQEGYRLYFLDRVWPIASITDSSHVVLTKPYKGPSGVGIEYQLEPNTNTTAQTATMQRLNDYIVRNNITLSGPGDPTAGIGINGQCYLRTGDGALSIWVKSAGTWAQVAAPLGGGAWDVQVATLAARNAYDNAATGFVVMVSDIGDGRAGIYTHLAGSGNWSAVGYLTGPIGDTGPANTLSIGTVASGMTASATITGTAPTQTLSLILPKGASGDGSGNVLGPVSSVDGHIALFDGVTGTGLKDGGASLTTVGKALAGAVDAAAARAVLNFVIPNYLTGLTLSNNVADATNDIDVATGVAGDSTNSSMLILSTGITKRLDASWAVGNANGGLDTGSIADGTYHVFLIQRSDTGVVDVLFSTSPTAPTMPTNYDRKRRVGSILRESGAIVLFKQRGREFIRRNSVLDYNVTNPAAATDITISLSVPTGVELWAIVMGGADQAGAIGASVYFSSLDQNDGLATAQLSSLPRVGNQIGAVLFANAILMIRTNASRQVKGNINTSDTSAAVLRMRTIGWVDPAGAV